MKRFHLWFAMLLTGVILLTACGGGGSTTGGGGAADIKPGASGMKDAALVGKWITADGGMEYTFKDDFMVTIVNVNATNSVAYDIREGGSGEGLVAIAEPSGNVIWTYKITGEQLDLTTPEGRAKKLKKGV